MHHGTKCIGSHKHGTSGHSSKSPRFRYMAKLEAERNVIRDTTRIRDPKGSVKELMASIKSR